MTSVRRTSCFRNYMKMMMVVMMSSWPHHLSPVVGVSARREELFLSVLFSRAALMFSF